METETPIWKYTAVAAVVIVACFFIGYFILGPSAARPTNEAGADGADSSATVTISDAPPGQVRPRPAQPTVQVEERTEEIEAEKRRKEEEARKQEEKRAEERRKEREEEKRRRQEEDERKEAEGTREDAGAATEPAEQRPDEPEREPQSQPNESAPIPPANDAGETPRPRETSSRPSTELHRVRVGSFENRDNAQNLARELNGRGYATYMEPEQVSGKTVYRIQVGAFRDEKQAREKQQELRANGYEATIATSR